MRRRQYLATSIGVVATAAGCTVIGQASQPDGYEPIVEFDDEGATVTDEFELEGGVTIAEAVHEGESNFIVELVPTDGKLTELLINVIGENDGASGVLADPGEYVLDVDADGEWEIDILQPDPAEANAEALPIELEGDGPTWDGPFIFEGLAQATGSHEADGNFIVEILTQDAMFPELVFNEIGQFEGETTFDVLGPGFITVEAAGPWTVTME